MSKYSVPVLSQPELALVKVQNRLEGAIAPQRVDFELVRDVAGTITEILVCFPPDASPGQVQGAVRALVELSERDPSLGATAAPGAPGATFSKVSGFEPPDQVDDTLPVAPFVGTRALIDDEGPRTGDQHVVIDSGAAAGDGALGCDLPQSVGAEVSAFDWTFWIRFPSAFNHNNNGVTGTGDIQLDLRLLGLVGGQSVVFRYIAQRRDSGDSPPPDFGNVDPNAGEATASIGPQGPSTIAFDGAYHKVRIRMISDCVLGHQIDSETESVFMYHGGGRELVVPRRLEVRHNWDTPLSRAFDIDDWSLTYELVGPTLT